MKKLSLIVMVFTCLIVGMARAENLLDSAGSRFVNADGRVVTLEPSAKIIGFYYSWRRTPEDTVFTEKLVNLYSELKQAGREFEIIFVCLDNTADKLFQYMRESNMPWPAVAHGSDARRSLIDIKIGELQARGIHPLLVILRDGEVITNNGVNDVKTLGAEAYDKWLSMTPAPPGPPTRISAGPLPPPEKESMTIDEVVAHQVNLEGKVVKTSINLVKKLVQVPPGWSIAQCAYEYNTDAPPFYPVLVPEAGHDFFEKIAERHVVSSRETIYLLVHENWIYGMDRNWIRLEAVGTRYRKNENEYSW